MANPHPHRRPRQAHAQQASELNALTLKQAAAGIKAKNFSPVDLTEACFESIKSWNPKINAWITVLREKALAQDWERPEEDAAWSYLQPAR